MSGMPGIALIGGTGLLACRWFRDASRHLLATPFGAVELVREGAVFFLQRHGLSGYVAPHRIAHRAHLMALKEVGVERILAVGSVGSLRRDIPPGAVVFPDDLFAPGCNPSFFDDHRAHRTPGFHGPWRAAVLAAWRRCGLPRPVDGGVYWQTAGPRFETPAEIRFHAPHVHVVGMTIASECILAGELGLPYAALCMVDNYANGLQPEPLAFDGFMAQSRANQDRLVAAVEALLADLAGREPESLPP